MKNQRKLRPRTVPYRRKRQQKTNYKKRMKLLMSSKARLVVRFTNQRIIAQLVNFETSGDKVILGVDSFSLRKLGWNFSCKNFPAAYLTGLILGKAAVAKGQKTAILDTGARSPLHKGKIYAFLKGVLDAGLEIPFTEDILPEDNRMTGKHIHNYAEKLKENQEEYQQRFAKYLKNKVQPENIVDTFEQVKQKI